MIVEKLTNKELLTIKDSPMLVNGWSPELTWAVENNDLDNDALKWIRLEWKDGWEMFTNLSEHMHKKLLTELVYQQIDKNMTAGYQSGTMEFGPREFDENFKKGYDSEFRNIAYDSVDMRGR